MRTERSADGRRSHTRAVLHGDRLMVSTSGQIDDMFTVIFQPSYVTCCCGGQQLMRLSKVRKSTLEKFFYEHTSIHRQTIQRRITAIKEAVPLTTSDVLLGAACAISLASRYVQRCLSLVSTHLPP